MGVDSLFIHAGSSQFGALGTHWCKSSGVQMYTFLLTISLVVELLGHGILRIRVCVFSIGRCCQFFKEVYQFALPILGIFHLFKFSPFW